MTGVILLYGATGYTGRMLASRMQAAGIDVVLAGRDVTKLEPLASRLGLPFRAFGLETPAAIDAALHDIDVVLHAAGPFLDTGAPMMAACLRRGAHYLDLAGEWPVFADAMALNDAAVSAGVMIMPGVGLTIVATDCLMAMVARAAPDAVKIRVGVSSPQVISRGTIETAARLMGPKAMIRRQGRLEAVPAGRQNHAFDFGAGLKEATVFSWPEVVTGEFTTGVPDIEIYTETDWPERLSYRNSALAMRWTGIEPWRALMEGAAALWPEGPTAAAKARAGFIMVAEATDAWRRPTRLRLRTLDGYTFSAITAQAIAQQVDSGVWAPGFQTPARVYGPDFVLGLGCASLDPHP